MVCATSGPTGQCKLSTFVMGGPHKTTDTYTETIDFQHKLLNILMATWLKYTMCV